jgi:hypothetical protein
MKKWFLASLVILSIVNASCGWGLTKEARRAFDDATVVFHYFAKSPDGPITFNAGPYQGGTAIIGPREVAFWVKDGTGYVVNEAAKEAAPELAQAPESVKYDDAFIEACIY